MSDTDNQPRGTGAQKQEPSDEAILGAFYGWKVTRILDAEEKRQSTRIRALFAGTQAASPVPSQVAAILSLLSCHKCCTCLSHETALREALASPEVAEQPPADIPGYTYDAANRSWFPKPAVAPEGGEQSEWAYTLDWRDPSNACIRDREGYGVITFDAGRCNKRKMSALVAAANASSPPVRDSAPVAITDEMLKAAGNAFVRAEKGGWRVSFPAGERPWPMAYESQLRAALESALTTPPASAPEDACCAKDNPCPIHAPFVDGHNTPATVAITDEAIIAAVTGTKNWGGPRGMRLNEQVAAIRALLTTPPASAPEMTPEEEQQRLADYWKGLIAKYDARFPVTVGDAATLPSEAMQRVVIGEKTVHWTPYGLVVSVPPTAADMAWAERIIAEREGHREAGVE